MSRAGHRPLDEPDLERQLLRRSIRLLAAGRHACVDCGRTPLTGERVHAYARGEVVCELCRPAHAGVPVRTDVVASAERGQTVRLRPRPLAA